MPPQPQYPRLAPLLAVGQALDLEEDERADYDWQRTPSALSCVVVDLGMQLGPRSYAYGSVTGVLAAMLGGRFGPGARIIALHLRPAKLATRASDVFGRVRETRVAIEASPGAQADEYLARTSLESLLHLDGIVARIEDEQRGSVSATKRNGPPQERPHLLGSDHVGVLNGPNAPHVHGSGPALAHEVKLCDELVGPSCHNGLTGGVARRMVVVAPLRTRLGVAAIPHANVHGIDGGLPFGASERMAGQKLP